VDAKRFKSGVVLVVVSQRTDVRFPFVGRFRCVDLFGFTSDKACFKNVPPNKLTQAAAFCRRVGYLSLRRRIKNKHVTYFDLDLNSSL
jgi:hypothetical protein